MQKLMGYSLLAIVALFAWRILTGLFGALLGLVFSLLWLAFVGFMIYLVIRVFSPSTADRIQEMISGKKPA
jgi:ABC-type lipoprotein release transport system permease subunit